MAQLATAFVIALGFGLAQQHTGPFVDEEDDAGDAGDADSTMAEASPKRPRSTTSESVVKRLKYRDVL